MRIENTRLEQIKQKLDIKGTLEIDNYKLKIVQENTVVEYFHQLLQAVERKECLYISYRNFVCIKLHVQQQELIFQELQRHIDTSRAS
jgi:hypothetical protein